MNVDVYICKDCGVEMKYHDKAKRRVKMKGGSSKWVYVKRYQCPKCGKIERKLPKNILPFKHYEKDIIEGVTEGWFTSDTLGYEDYPCEMTMKRWREEIAMEFAINAHFLQAPI